jgi:transcriptional regulator with XRE-family HTH domain
MKSMGPVARKGIRRNKQTRGGARTKADSAHAGGAYDLAALRLAAGKTQQQVAQEAGCSIGTVVTFEKGAGGRSRTIARAALKRIYDGFAQVAAPPPEHVRRKWERPDGNGDAGPGPQAVDYLTMDWLRSQVRTHLRENGLAVACEHCSAVVIRIEDVVALGRKILRVGGISVAGE